MRKGETERLKQDLALNEKATQARKGDIEQVHFDFMQDFRAFGPDGLRCKRDQVLSADSHEPKQTESHLHWDARIYRFLPQEKRRRGKTHATPIVVRDFELRKCRAYPAIRS